ncbi:MAG: arginase [Sulfuricella sp.]|nr:arginase [Sulfuricella sp.]
MKKIAIIGAACGLGAPDTACQDGPEVLRSLDFLSWLDENNILLHWDAVIHPAPVASPLQAVHGVCAQLAERVAATYAAGEFPLVVGGDHSCAIGTWSGMARALHEKGALGLLWIDAHMDSHTFTTTPSGALHGMPLACLLGYGERALTEIALPSPKLTPANVCLIGTRSFEASEAKLLAKLGVRIYGMEEIRKRGFAEVFREALEIITRNTAGFGISLDLDALDPAEEPGVGSPAPGGLFRSEVSDALHTLRRNAKFQAMEIVEYNPYRDRNFATAKAVSELVAAILSV